MKECKSRILGIDIIRSIAIGCAVICHVVEGYIYVLNVEFMQSISLMSKLFAFITFSIGRIGVPFFLMLSGYLLLDREYDDARCRKFWKTKSLGLLLVIQVWNIMYNIFNMLFFNMEISMDIVFRELFLLKDSSMNHMWYMPMILGLYFTLPIVANALQRFQMRTLCIPYIIFLIFSFGVPVLNEFFKISKEEPAVALISMGFSGGWYGLYLITGYMLKKQILKSISSKCLSLAVVISFTIVVTMQVYIYDNGITYNVWYDNLFLFVCGVSFFELLLRIKKIPFERCFIIVAKYSFAIYLVHNPINIVLQIYMVDVANKPIRVIIVWICTMILSLIISYLIAKIPRVGKRILYMK